MVAQCRCVTFELLGKTLAPKSIQKENILKSLHPEKLTKVSIPKYVQCDKKKAKIRKLVKNNKTFRGKANFSGLFLVCSMILYCL